MFDSNGLLVAVLDDVISVRSGLDVTTRGVANATGFYSVATNFSCLIARLAPNNIPLSKVK